MNGPEEPGAPGAAAFLAQCSSGCPNGTFCGPPLYCLALVNDSGSIPAYFGISISLNSGGALSGDLKKHGQHIPGLAPLVDYDFYNIFC